MRWDLVKPFKPLVWLHILLNTRSKMAHSWSLFRSRKHHHQRCLFCFFHLLVLTWNRSRRTLTNWTLEFEKWSPSVATIVYKGPPNARRALQQEVRYSNFQVLLTTFEYVIKDRPILSKIKWMHMIIDEGHRMKNTQSKLTLVLRQYYHSRYRLILTGTPLQVSKIWHRSWRLLSLY